MPETFVRVRMLIDTGSNISGLDHSFIKLLQLMPYPDTDEWVKGQEGYRQAHRYNCILYLSIFKKKAISFDVLGGDFKGSGFDGVLGRDILRFCAFKYDGINNNFSLTAKGF